MPAQEEIDHQQDLLDQHRRRLGILLNQQAQLGIAYTPPGTIADIQNACADIRQLKATLRAWGETVADLPDDDADRRTAARRTPSAQEGIALLRAREAVLHDLQDLIMRGTIFRDRIRTSPPMSQTTLDAESRSWDFWRHSTQQVLRQSFSSPEPLEWLNALIPQHLDFRQTWQTRANALLGDYEQELAFLNNLVMRLENYPEQLV